MSQGDTLLVTARIRLLPTLEGGRTTAVTGRYRPNHNFFAASQGRTTIVQIELGDHRLEPGDCLDLPVQFWNEPGLGEQIYPGREWRIMEGPHVIGMGTILEVLTRLDPTKD